MRLIMYGKESCHLCDDAELILRKLGVEAEYIDITTEAALQEKYGMRIPVLKRLDSGAELGWPFDAEKVSAFVAS